jgi:alpha-tubulin suppressor-like RCC1 family protein
VSAYGDTACAVTGDGSAWCWGYGYYGTRGDGTVNIYASSNARQVVTATGQGAPALTNIDQISVGQYHACAHQRSSGAGQGSVFCWGYNANGQLGNDAITQTNFAVQTQNLFDQASEVAVGGQLSCARTGPDVWCWGYAGQGVGDGTMGAKHLPTRVLTAADAGAFTGVVSIKAGSSGACALVGADKSVWCWGNTLAPTLASSANFPVSAISYWGLDANYICFGNSDGDLFFQNAKATQTVPCP